MRFVSGLILAVVICVAGFVALISTSTLVLHGVGSAGDLQEFESRIRHYTDRIEMAPDGVRFVGPSHPILQFVSMTAVSWIVLLAAIAAVRRLYRGRSSSRSTSG